MTFVGEQWLLFAVLGGLVVALIFVEGKKGGQTLSHHEVTRMVNSESAVIVDIRDAKEFKAGHIVDAIHIPHTKLSDRAVELEKHKADKTIILVDKMGQHAGASGNLLKEKGFNVNRLQGGMTEWVGQNLPVIKG